MRRFLSLLALSFALGCGDDTLGPVNTVDGLWTGVQNGFSLSLSMAQAGQTVSGVATIGGISGFAEGTISGVFNYPSISLVISIPGAEPVNYTGTMSASEASIDGKLNGSGFVDRALAVKKKKS